MYLLGVDEAGYGPNLGPLVIGASLWRIAEGEPPHDWYAACADCIAPAPDGERLAIADSKALYQAGGSLAPLEAGVFAALSLLGSAPCGWSELLAALDSHGRAAACPWEAELHPCTPQATEAEVNNTAAARWGEALSRNGIEFQGLFVRLVFPAEWNRLLERTGNKATALSETTLELVAQVLARAPGKAHVVCDKHGGRSRYAALLQQRFPEYLVEVGHEGAEESCYAWGPRERRISFAFRRGGESFLPAALASMAAKYVRELSMQAFNAFWRREVENLRPTAGYPVDAARFRRDIAAAQARLGIEDHALWRNR